LAEEVTYPKYRWLLLSLAWALYSLIAFNNTMTAVLYDLRDPIALGGLGLTDQQFYACLTATSIAPIVLALFGGMLSDRFGVRWTVFAGSIIAAGGTLLRLVSTGFPDFFAFNLLLGVGLGVIGPNLPKMVGMWFPPRQIAISTALYMTALGIGSGLGLALGPLFPTWRSAMLIMGMIFVASVVIWLFFAKDRPKGYKVDGVEMAEKIGVTKQIYMFCMIMSGTAGIIGYLLAPGIGMWLNAVFPGFFMGAGHPFIMQVPLRLREIGPRYVGVAAGIIGSLGHLLSFILLPYMFEPIWHGVGSWQGFGPFSAAIFLAAVLAVGGILYILAPETGRKAREEWEREAAEAQASSS